MSKSEAARIGERLIGMVRNLVREVVAANDASERAKHLKPARTLAEFWTAHHWPLLQTKRQGTREEYEYRWRFWIEPDLGACSWSELTRQRVGAWTMALRSQHQRKDPRRPLLAPATICGLHAALSSILSHAVALGLLEGKEIKRLRILAPHTSGESSSLNAPAVHTKLDETTKAAVPLNAGEVTMPVEETAETQDRVNGQDSGRRPKETAKRARPPIGPVATPAPVQPAQASGWAPLFGEESIADSDEGPATDRDSVSIARALNHEIRTYVAARKLTATTPTDNGRWRHAYEAERDAALDLARALVALVKP